MAPVQSRKGGFSHDSPLLPRPGRPIRGRRGQVFCYAANKNSRAMQPGTTLLSESRERRAVIGQ